jgi:AraC family transcriptional regulator, transcriptional activator FtrA
MSTPSNHAGNSVALALAGDISIMEVAGPCEIFGVRRTELADPWYDFSVYGTSCARVGGRFRPDDAVQQLNGLAKADTIIVPGLRDPAVQSPPAQLINAVRSASEAGARLVSICTGAFILAEAGLLDGRQATTHWKHSDLLATRYPAVKVDPDVLYTDEGDVLTAAGMAAGIDLCLHIVRNDYGSAVANALARQLVTPPHREGGQTQFITPPVAESTEHALSGLLSWVTANLDQPLTVCDMSQQANMSTRNLARHFNAVTGKAPLQWLLTQRIYRVRELLERTDYTVERIATESGMVTAATLRRHFRRAVGVTPDSYRRTFRNGTGHGLGPASA